MSQKAMLIHKWKKSIAESNILPLKKLLTSTPQKKTRACNWHFEDVDFFHLTEEFICCSLFQALKVYLMWSYGNVSVKCHCHWSVLIVTEMVKSFSLPFEVKMIKMILQRNHSGKSTFFTKCKLVFGWLKFDQDTCCHLPY